jgi:hypothetical protein
VDRIFDGARRAFKHARIAIDPRIFMPVLQFRRRTAHWTWRRRNHIAIDFSHDFASCKTAAKNLLVLAMGEWVGTAPGERT